VALLTEAQRVFASYGIAPEELLWTGRPPAGIRLRRADIYLIPFSLMWAGLAILWESAALIGHAPWFFRLWGIPFVVVGLYISVGRFFWDSYRRGKTWYGLTADSALILIEGSRRSLQRLYLPSVSSIGLDLSANGTGTISFGDVPARWFAGEGWNGWSGGPLVPSFEGIPDAQQVYELCGGSQRRVVAPGAAANPVP
jgi:hypothetical protein